MELKAKLEDCLRLAQSDPSLRKELLDNARLARATFGWLALVCGVWLSFKIAYEAWRSYPDHSGPEWALFILTAMAYDKFGDRVAMLKSMERPGQPPAPNPPVTQTAEED